MKISIHQGGRILREHYHQGARYIEAPPAGDYAIRITNDSPARRMAVLSVDGINAINGADASFDGPGYVLDPWGSVEVPGWHRGNKEVASFSFREQTDSYAAQTGRGTRNVGVIGIAVFDEKVRSAPLIIEEHHHHHEPWSWAWPWPKTGPRHPRPHSFWEARYGTAGGGPLRAGVTLSASDSHRAYGASAGDTTVSSSVENSASQGAMDVGTAYGSARVFHTTSVDFERATAAPAEVVTLRYATRERLKSWGVQVDAPQTPAQPQAFPLSQGCPPPPDWRG